MSRDESPWHTVSVAIVRFWDERAHAWDTELERVIEEHPAECDALPYGQNCWFDRELGEFPDDYYPTEAGYYAAMIWGDGPDHNGEYDGGLDWELITPALPPLQHTHYGTWFLGKGITLPTPVNGVRLWPNVRHVPLERPLGPSPWRLVAEHCPRCGKFTRAADMRLIPRDIPLAADGVPREPLHVCVRCASTRTAVRT